jgi:hypothetical protein
VSFGSFVPLGEAQPAAFISKGSLDRLGQRRALEELDVLLPETQRTRVPGLRLSGEEKGEPSE